MKYLDLKLICYKPNNSSLRFTKLINRNILSKIKPNKQLSTRLKKFGGRNNLGRQTNFNKGGGSKQLYRILHKINDDFKGILCTIEYDPIRSGLIGCIFN